jgi:hypothetical protein
VAWLDDLTFETVIIHTKDGVSIKGLKSVVHDDGILLREACLLEETGLVMLDYDPFVPRDNVSWMQIVA